MRQISPVATEPFDENVDQFDAVDARFSVRRMWPALLATVVFNALVGFLATHFLNVAGVIGFGLVSLLATVAVWWFFTHKGKSIRGLIPVIGLCSLGLGLGVALVGGASPTRVEPGACDGNYSPCIPTLVDVNCSDLRTLT